MCEMKGETEKDINPKRDKRDRKRDEEEEMKRKRESAVDLTRQSVWRKRRSSLCSAPSSQADRADRLTDTYCVGRTDGRYSIHVPYTYMHSDSRNSIHFQCPTIVFFHQTHQKRNIEGITRFILVLVL